MHTKLNTLVLAVMLWSLPSRGQDSLAQKTSLWSQATIEYQIQAGFNLGGSTPIPFPASIRKINQYNPTLGLGLEAHATLWHPRAVHWGIRVGLRVENKHMKTDATVQSYATEIFGSQGEKVKGYFTGDVKTTVKNAYLSLPILVGYQMSKQWDLFAGPYFSYALDTHFSGFVYNGYLRADTPTGNKTVFSEENIGIYDFSDQMNNFQWGATLASQYRINPHLNVQVQLNCAANNLFKKDFSTVDFNMYSVYLSLGVGYLF